MQTSSNQTASLFQTPREILRGTVNQIVYSNAETSYTVLRLILNDTEESVTVVGKFLDVQPGEELQLQGQWSENPRYGRQFRCEHYVRSKPSTLKGIQRYLGGMVKGIGPHLAKQLVRYFGFDTLRIIEEEPERLSEVKGIGASRAMQIRAAWQEHQAQQEVMVFLQGHGISLNHSIKIFRTYGQETIGLLRDNPYRLATDIRGIGFRSADQIAQSLGLPFDSPFRAEAGILFHLQMMSDQGHVFYPQTSLLAEVHKELGISIEKLTEAIAVLEGRQEIWLEPFEEDDVAVFRSVLAACERGASSALLKLLNRHTLKTPSSFDKAVDLFEKKFRIQLAPAQRQAVEMALCSPVSIITGGPGTGKTTIIRAVCELIKEQGADILLAAPTGRAAKRLGEATGEQAKTLHRLLDFSPHEFRFMKDKDNPLRADFVIVDEASMIDIFLFYALIRAVPEHAQLVFVGDVDQLPSVGPGNVLSDLIASDTIPVTTLNQIFRQAQHGLIIENAHRINQGLMPILPAPKPNQLLDFYFIPRSQPQQVAQIISDLVCERIPKRFGFQPLDIQVISPMYRGDIGVTSLNRMLQQRLSNEGASLSFSGNEFFRGDRVLQMRNNYDKDVFNGDVGVIEEIDAKEIKMTVLFDGRAVAYDRTDIDELTLAYAISVHKSQGSEYPAVVIPVHSQHFVMLQRNLLYTGMTRGKRLVVLVGDKRSLNIAVSNDRIRKRCSRLDWRLQEALL
ncbi:MAG TPA: ATP-dependent RecD-like DNA helicase [Myxococcales bacterium]|nr:ATP-dependent RecD-like DNA helicase [Deltaproteobacteria bacterium]MBU54509.1 ATP-dependent RecD-like DNA helicase [Deltaproteobacteria bacterium]HAA55626.1 ATP-dependent RecD-like DNA helicase [Myxococcales bacterium]|tara:strand:- start:1293 stop:3497 length:2205 start_codon:yes stop_codon:yes gene_type:complete